jgi:hypothetical protein
MAKQVSQLKQVAPEFQSRRGAVKAESVLVAGKIAQVIFDTAGNDSAGVSNKTVAAHGLGVYLPIGAVITRAWYQVKTSFLSTAGGSNLATIALSVNGANDLVAAIAIADGSNVWNAGVHGTLAGSYAERTVNADTAILDAASKAASMIGPVSAEKELTATVAVAALTAGKLILWVEYVQGL